MSYSKSNIVIIIIIILNKNSFLYKCGNGKIRVRNRARGPNPRRWKGPPTHQFWPNTWMRIRGGKTKLSTS